MRKICDLKHSGVKLTVHCDVAGSLEEGLEVDVVSVYPDSGVDNIIDLMSEDIVSELSRTAGATFYSEMREAKESMRSPFRLEAA